ncbi:MAG TPA: hypothetical protein VGM54_03930 [Chthoniobacter sp.]|jgi:hypothetical protein
MDYEELRNDQWDRLIVEGESGGNIRDERKADARKLLPEAKPNSGNLATNTRMHEDGLHPIFQLDRYYVIRVITFINIYSPDIYIFYIYLTKKPPDFFELASHAKLPFYRPPGVMTFHFPEVLLTRELLVIFRQWRSRAPASWLPISAEPGGQRMAGPDFATAVPRA